MKTVVVTGSAGFIGSYITTKLLDNNYKVIGIDNLNNYYDVNLKNDRLNNILNMKNNNFSFFNGDINNKEKLDLIFKEYKPDIVVHLAGYAGVRYSIENPDIYIKNNVLGFNSILDLSVKYNVEHFIFASSSSVYGNSKAISYSEEASTNNPESIYAATKKCDEVLSYAYSSLYDTNITGLRLFTVYGPFGRPDMAYFNFTNKLINHENIYLYNNGNLERDFTYIDDVINGIFSIIESIPKEKFNIYNIGSSNPYSLTEFVNILKHEIKENGLVGESTDLDSLIKYTEMKKGEALKTYADITKMKIDFGYEVKYNLESGLKEFIKWYKEYYYGSSKTRIEKF